MALLRQVADRRLGLRPVEQRRVDPNRVEPKAAVGRIAHRPRRHPLQRIRLQAPQENPEIGDVPAAPATADAPHLGRAGCIGKGRIDQVEAIGPICRRGVPGRGAQVGRAEVRWADVVDVLGGAQQLKELDGPGPPVGHIPRQLFQDRSGALAATVAQRVGDIGAVGIDPGAPDGVQRRHAQQIADIGQDPRIGGFDEPVLVQPFDIGLDQLELALNDGEQRPQGFALGAVPQPVDGG